MNREIPAKHYVYPTLPDLFRERKRENWERYVWRKIQKRVIYNYMRRSLGCKFSLTSIASAHCLANGRLGIIFGINSGISSLRSASNVSYPCYFQAPSGTLYFRHTKYYVCSVWFWGDRPADIWCCLYKSLVLLKFALAGSKIWSLT